MAALRRPEFTGELLAELASEFAEARGSLVSQDPIGESDYNLLEETSGRWIELRRGIARQRPARMAGGVLVPSGPVAGSH